MNLFFLFSFKHLSKKMAGGVGHDCTGEPLCRCGDCIAFNILRGQALLVGHDVQMVLAVQIIIARRRDDGLPIPRHWRYPNLHHDVDNFVYFFRDFYDPPEFPDQA